MLTETLTIPRRVVTGAGLTAVALAASLSAAIAVPSAASAAPAARTTTNRVQAAAAWLSTQFEGAAHVPTPAGNHFDVKYGKDYYPLYGENDDVIFALAAAKAGAAKVAVATAYLRKNVEAYADPKGTLGGPFDGALGKLAVGAEVSGVKATAFGGYNLLALLKKDECAVGSTKCTPGEAAGIYSSISESFVLIAESRAGGTYAPSTAAKTYFGSLQCTSGGFTSDTTACGTGAADVDSTSYAIMAMQAMGDTGPTLTNAVTWLQSQQHPAGYWSVGTKANTNSTGLAASALQGVGASLGKARGWLTAQQKRYGRAAGALRYNGSVAASTAALPSPSVLATAQGLVGLVDGSSLATLTAAHSTKTVAFFAPALTVTTPERAGRRYIVSGTGFAAGERVRIRLGARTLATVTAGPVGGIRVAVRVPAAFRGRTAYSATGLSSGLAATHRVRITH